MALVELGLTEDQFFSMPPFRTYIMQLSNQRRSERLWEKVRFLGATQYNTAFGAKRTIRPQQLIKLSLDKAIEYPEWTKAEADDLINKWGGKN